MIYNFDSFFRLLVRAPSSSTASFELFFLVPSRLRARVQLNVVFSPFLNCRYVLLLNRHASFRFHRFAFRCDSNAFALHTHTHTQSSEWTIIWTVPFDRVICCKLHKVLSNTTGSAKKKKGNNNGIIRTTTHRNDEKPMWSGKWRVSERAQEMHEATKKKIVANQMQKISTNLLLSIMFAVA